VQIESARQENDGQKKIVWLENAGHEIDGQNCRARNARQWQ